MQNKAIEDKDETPSTDDINNQINTESKTIFDATESQTKEVNDKNKVIANQEGIINKYKIDVSVLEQQLEQRDLELKELRSKYDALCSALLDIIHVHCCKNKGDNDIIKDLEESFRPIREKCKDMKKIIGKSNNRNGRKSRSPSSSKSRSPSRSRSRSRERKDKNKNKNS